LVCQRSRVLTGRPRRRAVKCEVGWLAVHRSPTEFAENRPICRPTSVAANSFGSRLNELTPRAYRYTACQSGAVQLRNSSKITSVSCTGRFVCVRRVGRLHHAFVSSDSKMVYRTSSTSVARLVLTRPMRARSSAAKRRPYGSPGQANASSASVRAALGKRHHEYLGREIEQPFERRLAETETDRGRFRPRHTATCQLRVHSAVLLFIPIPGAAQMLVGLAYVCPGLC
jgi:hypothetical protein